MHKTLCIRYLSRDDRRRLSGRLVGLFARDITSTTPKAFKPYIDRRVVRLQSDVQSRRIDECISNTTLQ